MTTAIARSTTANPSKTADRRMRQMTGPKKQPEAPRKTRREDTQVGQRIRQVAADAAIALGLDAATATEIGLQVAKTGITDDAKARQMVAETARLLAS